MMYKIAIILILIIILINNISQSKTTDTKNKEHKEQEIEQNELSKDASLTWIKEYKEYKLSKKEKNIIKELANKKRIHILNIFGFKVYLKFNRQNTGRTRHDRFIEAINEGSTLRKTLRD